MKQYKGDLEGFPSEVVEKMLDEQERQGNERDVGVFEHWDRAGLYEGGFTWSDSDEGHNFWLEVIYRKDFDLFFERYPRISTNKCKIIYAQGKEVVFDLDNFTIENNMLIIKAK